MDGKHNLLILGAGEYGHVVKEIAEDSGAFDGIAFLDDSNPSAIGKFGELNRFSGEYRNAVVAVGNADLRERLIEALKSAGYEMPAIISPKAYVSKSARIGKNTVVEPFAVVHTASELANGVFLCAGAIVNHNCKIGDFCTLQCGSIVPANSVVAAKTTVDYNMVFDNRFSGPIDKRTPVGNGYRFEEGM